MVKSHWFKFMFSFCRVTLSVFLKMSISGAYKCVASVGSVEHERKFSANLFGYCVTYNCMSLSREGRLEAILQAMKWATVVCIQGTMHRQPTVGDLGEHSLPVHAYEIGQFYIIDAGVPTKGNKHAGVPLAINKEHINPTFIRCPHFTPSLRTRFEGSCCKKTGQRWAICSRRSRLSRTTALWTAFMGETSR